MKWPLLGSAAGHLVLLSALLLLGAAAGPGAVGVVQVVLVEGAGSAPSGAGEPPPVLGRNASWAAAIRAGAGGAPVHLPSSAAPAGSSPGPGEVPPKSSTASPADEAAPPPAVKPPPPSSAVASLSGGTAFLSSIRIGGGAAPPGARGGADLPAAGEGSGGKGGDLPGTAAGGASGGPGTAALAGGGASGPAWGGSGGGREVPEAGLMREKIQSAIVYPEEAIRRGREGEVLLRIRIGAGGIPREIRVSRSSGARVLDEAARRGVVRAAPLPSGPGWVEVPVRFSLH